MLKKLTQEDKDEFGDIFGTCKIDQDKCIGCKLCMKVGCPAISSEKIEGKNVVSIDPLQCTGCEVCAQVCPKDAIEREVN
jgi:indolepyruvate ferredoxin oxidoreductase alpha subunit